MKTVFMQVLDAKQVRAKRSYTTMARHAGYLSDRQRIGMIILLLHGLHKARVTDLMELQTALFSKIDEQMRGE